MGSASSPRRTPRIRLVVDNRPSTPAAAPPREVPETNPRPIDTTDPEVWNKIRSGDLVLRDAVLAQHLPQVQSTVRSMCRGGLRGEQAELLSGARVGLWKAIQDYDPATKVPFACYASFRIRGNALDGLRDQDWASRVARISQARISTARSGLRKQLLREPESPEIAAAMGVSLEQYHQIETEYAYARNFVHQTIEPGSAPEDEPAPRGVMEADVPDPDPIGPEVVAILRERQDLVHRLLATLDPVQQSVMSAHYLEDKSLKIVSQEMGWSESRLSQIHQQALQRLRRRLRPMDIRATRDISPESRGVTAWAQPVPAQPACQ